MSSEPSQRIHPLFSAPDADVALHSKDGTVFQTHSLVLKTTSGFFRTMFALPQPDDTPSLSQGDHNRNANLHLEEDEHTIEGLLRMVTGIEIPIFNSFEFVESMLFAAEKYDMPGPISIIHSFILSPAFLPDPLHIYVLACRFHWDDIAITASTLTLKTNLLAPNTETQNIMYRLDAKNLIKLLELHWSRKEGFRQGLDSAERFSAGNADVLNCGHGNTDHSWPKLKLAMLNEMNQCPAGDRITGPGFVNWPEWQAFAIAQCSRCVQIGGGDATRLLYTHERTLVAIREVIDELPKSI